MLPPLSLGPVLLGRDTDARARRNLSLGELSRSLSDWRDALVAAAPSGEARATIERRFEDARTAIEAMALASGDATVAPEPEAA